MKIINDGSIQSLKSFDLNNTPVLFKKAISNWNAVQNWDLSYLKSKLKNIQVRLVKGNREQNKPEFITMMLHDYFGYLENPQNETPLYLKEYNLFKQAPELKKDVNLKSLFQGQFLVDHGCWIGPKNAETGLHFDKFNNVLSQIKGTKIVKLIPKHLKNYAYPTNKLDYFSCLFLVDAFTPNYSRYPKFKDIEDQVITLTLEEGDLVYIPKGWLHQVQSLETTISINGFMIHPSDLLFKVPFELIKHQVHKTGLYKKNNCTCHQYS